METTNLSKIRRDKMLNTINEIKKNISDEETLTNLSMIENELTKKKYGLIWEEHEERVDKELETQIPTFEEIKDKEIVFNPDDKFNFLLEGDNLHSLYLLEKTHAGKIDIIYIDPPYNTGNKDFMYNDTYIDSEDEYKHSKWLSFMERRLQLAKFLLNDDGYIFISINYREQAQLKLLCDDIFGENNLIGEISWESTTQPINSGSAKFGLQQKTEWILVYAKNSLYKKCFKLKEIDNGLKYPHIGKLGKCRFEVIEKSDAGGYKRDTMKFEILGHKPRAGKRWQIGKETAQHLIENNRIEIVNGIVKKAVYPEDELDRIKYAPFWSHFSSKEVGTAQNGKDELNNILSRAVGFDTVKPINLIKEILYHFNNDITILDFFAGSGTTAQTVLELNKEDGGNRQFILCTNNENNICEDITYERIKTVITGKRKDSSKYSDGIQANLKYYRCTYIPRINTENENLHNNLLVNITNLIQLENGIEIDNDKIRVYLDEDELDSFSKNQAKLDVCEKVYISSDILLTSMQETIFKNNNIEVYIIPEYYFEDEIMEVM